MSVVRRDRYRCRGCDKTGDEITLRVFPIRGDLSLAKEMITLCTRCHGLVIDTGLTANEIPDFLRQLWYCLHHADEEWLPASRDGGACTDSASEPLKVGP